MDYNDALAFLSSNFRRRRQHLQKVRRSPVQCGKGRGISKPCRFRRHRQLGKAEKPCPRPSLHRYHRQSSLEQMVRCRGNSSG